MIRQDSFAPLEWYHLYSRGIDKRIVFGNQGDFERFLKLLYLGNDTKEINLELLKKIPYRDIFTLPRTPIVAMGAHCLMDNHPHLLVQEKIEGGITKFMRKIGTAYTMYFNTKYSRIGNLMVKPFRSKHISEDGYFHRVAQYIHLNPAEIFEPGWKQGIVNNPAQLEKKLLEYKYSSLPDYFGKEKRPEHTILDAEAFGLIKENLPPLAHVLKEAQLYYQEIESSLAVKPRGRPKKVSPFN
ncbi:MAG: transposase [Patescibacteria group bacterium]